MVYLLYKSKWKFFKKLNVELPYKPAVPFLSIYISRRNKSGDLNRYLHTLVHRSIIHNRESVETTKISIDG